MGITGGNYREDTDTGSTVIHRDIIIRSLDPELAKLWICERLAKTKCARDDT
jgi:hypothetical protein